MTRKILNIDFDELAQRQTWPYFTCQMLYFHSFCHIYRSHLQCLLKANLTFHDTVFKALVHEYVGAT